MNHFSELISIDSPKFGIPLRYELNNLDNTLAHSIYGIGDLGEYGIALILRLDICSSFLMAYKNNSSD